MSNHDEPQPYVSAADLGSAGATAAEAPEDIRLPLGRLLAIRPFGVNTVIPSDGGKPFPARECYVIAVGYGGVYEDLGMRECSWQAVMRELDKATDEAPWIVGTIKKGGRAFFIDPPTTDEMKTALRSIAQLIDDRRAEEASGQQGSFATNEEPF